MVGGGVSPAAYCPRGPFFLFLGRFPMTSTTTRLKHGKKEGPEAFEGPLKSLGPSQRFCLLGKIPYLLFLGIL